MALEGLQLGQYRLLHLLGGGGMGEVYVAEDARIHQQVAIKISRTETHAFSDKSSAEDSLRLFLREAKTIAQLDHPHILPLYSFGEEQVNGMTFIYMVMPYRREGSFADWLHQHGKTPLLPGQEVAFFLTQAASALQYAHSQHIIHQDVKAPNFLLRTNPERPGLPDLLLADFGIARLSSATSLVSHAIRGTPISMAPEQWSGTPVYATDQYALAILAYELLAGRPPFEGRQEQLMYQHFHAQPPPLRTFNPQFPQVVDSIILKALAKQPEDRFPTIADFAQAYRDATAHLKASSLINLAALPKTEHQHITLAISKAEAQEGTRRTLTLPGGRHVSVSIPAGAYHGQVLRLPDLDNPLHGEPVGTFMLMLAVQEEDEISLAAYKSAQEPTALIHPAREDADKRALPSSLHDTSPEPLDVGATPKLADAPRAHSVPQQRGISTGTAILLVGLAFVVIIGALGFFAFLYTGNRSSPNLTNVGSSPQKGRNPRTLTSTPTVTGVATSANQLNPATPTPQTGTSSSYVRLNSSYSGTASGYAEGVITFTLTSQDQQGNITMLTTFQQLGNAQKTASYSCQGVLTTSRHLSLQCADVTNASYQLAIQGYVYPDGHMEGTEIASNTTDSGYRHVYLWKAH